MNLEIFVAQSPKGIPVEFGKVSGDFNVESNEAVMEEKNYVGMKYG